MKYIIKENRLQSSIISYFDEYYKNIVPHDLTPGWRRGGLDIYDPGICKIYFGSSNQFVNFSYYKKCYAKAQKVESTDFPRLWMDSEKDTEHFDSYFGHLWHDPFVKWFEDKFNLQVKRFHL